jgi:hypothetical protein
MAMSSRIREATCHSLSKRCFTTLRWARSRAVLGRVSAVRQIRAGHGESVRLGPQQMQIGMENPGHDELRTPAQRLLRGRHRVAPIALKLMERLSIEIGCGGIGAAHGKAECIVSGHCDSSSLGVVYWLIHRDAPVLKKAYVPPVIRP